MTNYRYTALPWNIRFAANALQELPIEIDKLGFSRALILTTANQSDDGKRLFTALGHRAVGLFDEAQMHVPVETLDKAIVVAKKMDADCTIALGGGSTTGLGKAMAVEMGLDNIVIPTSYAGSEMTDIWGVTKLGRKVTARDMIAVPTLTIYDPSLTLSMPVKFSVVSGLNAMAQAVVNVATIDANPMIVNFAIEGIHALSQSLPKIFENPCDFEARSNALYGASMAGAALGTGVTSLHHRLCHTFGGTFNTPHAETHAILLAHCVAYNTNATKKGTNKVAEALGVNNAAIGIYELAKRLEAPLALKDLGISKSDLDKAVEVSLEKPLNNPEPVSKARLKKLLLNAFNGRSPEAID